MKWHRLTPLLNNSMNIMNKLTSLTAILFYVSLLNIWAQENVPEGFHLLYQQDFSSAEAINQFEMTDPSAWKAVTGKEGYLELFGKSNYEARVRSPFNIALLKEYMFGEMLSCLLKRLACC